MATEAAELEKEAPEAPAFVVELDDTETAAAKAEVLESHKGKAEIELEKEIAAAIEAKAKAKQEEAAPIIAKMAELAKDEANKDKTDEELLALASEALASKEDAEENDTDEVIFSGGLGKKPAADAAPQGTDPAKPVVALPDDVKARLIKLDQLESDPVYKAYLGAKESNADIDLVELIVNSGLTNNPEKITDPAFFKRIEINQMRQADPSITDDDVTEFLEDFSAKSKLAQWAEVKGIKEAMVSEYHNAKSLLATKISSGSEATKESVKQLVAEADKELRNYEGENFFGVTVTEAHRQKVVNAISTGSIVVRGKDGKVDVAKTAEAVLFLEQRNDMFKAYFEMGKKQAERKAALKSGNPLRGLKVRSSQARVAAPDNKAEFEAAKKALRPEWASN
jgi:hypothetical protein